MNTMNRMNMPEKIARMFPKSYGLVYRGGYWQIEQDATSPQFHPTQLMSMCIGVTFPPYNEAGICDVVTFLMRGERSTCLNKNNQIAGFDMAECQAVDLMPEMQKRFPEITSYALLKVKDIETSVKGWDVFNDHRAIEAFAKEVEDKFGASVIIDRKDFPDIRDFPACILGNILSQN